MGEKSVRRECILGNFAEKEACCVEDSYLVIAVNVPQIRSFCAAKLKYVHGEAFGNDKCKFAISLETALMVKSISGDKNYGS